jgi:hypothetical protein
MNRLLTVPDIRAVCMFLGDERYTLLFTVATRTEALRQLGRWASNPDLSFTWFDAATMSQAIREEKFQ